MNLTRRRFLGLVGCAVAGASLGQFTVEEKQGLDPALSRQYSELFTKTLEAHRQMLHDQLFRPIPWIDYMKSLPSTASWRVR